MCVGNLVGDKASTGDFMDFVYWLRLLYNAVTSLFVLVSYLCVLYHNFHCCFPVISLRQSLVSGIFIPEFLLTWIVL
jgi:hypothetical protein